MKTVVALIALFVSSGVAAEATPILASPPSGYPAPGGTTATVIAGTSLGDATGIYRRYTGFTSSAWDELFFGIGKGSLEQTGTGAPITSFDTDLTTFTTSGNSITWNVGTWTVQSVFGPVSTPVLLTTSFYQNDGLTPLLASDLQAGTVAGMPNYVLQFTPTELAAWGGGFVLQSRYTTGTGAPILTGWYNPISTPAGASTSLQTSGEFWYEPPAAVPEPASLVLLGSGLVAGARRIRRRKMTAAHREVAR